MDNAPRWFQSRLVDVGDRRLAVSSAGEGRPAVVLEIGLAALSTASEHIIAERSGHLINVEQPEVIVEGIQRAIAMSRARE